MFKKTVLILYALFAVGCAARQGGSEAMASPQSGTREALLPTYEPTGSACLDSVIVNMLYAGCSSIVNTTSLDTPVSFIGCLSPQPGALDMFSKGTIVHTIDPTLIPPGAQPFCGDPTGIYAMWPISFIELTRNEQQVTQLKRSMIKQDE